MLKGTCVLRSLLESHGKRPLGTLCLADFRRAIDKGPCTAPEASNDESQSTIILPFLSILLIGLVLCRPWFYSIQWRVWAHQLC